MRKLYIFGLIALATVIVGLALADEMTFTTYYPAPAGVYNDMTVMNRLGIGTTTPGEKLEIETAGYQAFTTEWDNTNNKHKSGIKFKEGGSDVYGAQIYYDGQADKLILSTLENTTERYGISIDRSTGVVSVERFVIKKRPAVQPNPPSPQEGEIWLTP